MPLRPDPFLSRFERLRDMRGRPWIGYGVAFAAVAAAALARGALGDLLVHAPFLTFYPAILLAALIGGLRSGGVATLLSAVTADYLFVGPVGALAATLSSRTSSGRSAPQSQSSMPRINFLRQHAPR